MLFVQNFLHRLYWRPRTYLDHHGNRSVLCRILAFGNLEMSRDTFAEHHRTVRIYAIHAHKSCETKRPDLSIRLLGLLVTQQLALQHMKQTEPVAAVWSDVPRVSQRSCQSSLLGD